jgi:hypothetical protein
MPDGLESPPALADPALLTAGSSGCFRLGPAFRGGLGTLSQ